MTSLLELREDIKRLYSRYSRYILIGARFLLALVAISMAVEATGYSSALSGMLPTLILAVFCALIPAGSMCAVIAVMILAQMYSLSLLAFALTAVVFLLIFLLYFRFSPRDSMLIVLTPVCLRMGLPYVVPMAAGLFLTPVSALPIALGFVVYSLLSFVGRNETALVNVSGDSMAATLQLIMQGVFADRTMLAMIAASAVCVVLVYYVRRMRVAYAWSAAVAAGAVSQLMILLIGDVVYDTNLNIGLVFLGMTASVAVCILLAFFFFNLDYSRIEQLQFEDDDYYYYVKAVPKVSLKTRERTVKTISRATRRGDGGGRREYRAADRDRGYEDDDEMYGGNEVYPDPAEEYDDVYSDGYGNEDDY